MWLKQILTDKFQFPVHWHNTSLHPFPLFLAKYKEMRWLQTFILFLLNIPVPLKRNTFQVPLDLNVFHIYTKMNKPDVNTQQQTLYFFYIKTFSNNLAFRHPLHKMARQGHINTVQIYIS